MKDSLGKGHKTTTYHISARQMRCQANLTAIPGEFCGFWTGTARAGERRSGFGLVETRFGFCDAADLAISFAHKFDHIGARIQGGFAPMFPNFALDILFPPRHSRSTHHSPSAVAILFPLLSLFHFYPVIPLLPPSFPRKRESRWHVLVKTGIADAVGIPKSEMRRRARNPPRFDTSRRLQ